MERTSLKTLLHKTVIFAAVFELLSCGGVPTAPQPSVASRTSTIRGGNPKCAATTGSAKTTGSTTGLKLADPTVGYTDTVKAILDKYCVSCHRPNATPPDLSTYATASAPIARKDSLTDINNDSMPTGPKKLTADEKAKFAAWVAGGAIETAKTAGAGAPAPVGAPPSTADACSANVGGAQPPSTTPPATTPKPTPGPTPAPTPTPSPTPTPTPAPMTATVTYQNAIASYLNAQCAGCHGGRSPQLENYAQAKAGAAASLASMKAGRMPTSRRATAAEIATFEKWVNAGMPEK